MNGTKKKLTKENLTAWRLDDRDIFIFLFLSLFPSSHKKAINMATTTASTEIKIVNISNLAKIESFINDSAYKELIENSENYNKRLCIEQRMRMPFLDSQTGIAQTHSALFMKKRQRMPGSIQGQIYSYPAGRWRKSRRQYLIHQHRPFRVIREPDPDSLQGLERSSIGVQDNDSKDSTHREEQPPKEWFYDEVNMHEIDVFDERELDSDFDYDDGNYKKKRRGRRPNNPEGTTRRGRGRGRGRRKMLDNDREPRTPKRGGKAANQSSSSANLSASAAATTSSSATATTTYATLAPSSPLSSTAATKALSTATTTTTTMAAVDESSQPASAEQSSSSIPEEEERLRKTTATGPGGVERGKAVPSPYCDFCLGDSRENRKTSIPEDLVSCSDCGRSGHPTCLQFTPNMIISVRRYRWQCIECKYCSICGTSDNDDQLLFCDDCDRGYHMYCLSPPLILPPEGSWSCNICHEEFHKPAAV